MNVVVARTFIRTFVYVHTCTCIHRYTHTAFFGSVFMYQINFHVCTESKLWKLMIDNKLIEIKLINRAFDSVVLCNLFTKF